MRCSAPRRTAAGGRWACVTPRTRPHLSTYRCRPRAPCSHTRDALEACRLGRRRVPHPARRRHASTDAEARRAGHPRQSLRQDLGQKPRWPPMSDDSPGEPFTKVFAAALRGVPCAVVGLGPEPSPLPVARWTGGADASDRAVLAHCARGHPRHRLRPRPDERSPGRARSLVLGVDVVAEAVEQTRARGAAALRRDVFAPLPGEGRWETALLADGNIGIGGDPVRLLRRVHDLLAPGGAPWCDLAPHGTGLRTVTVTLRTPPPVQPPLPPGRSSGSRRSGRSRDAAGFVVEATHEHAGRWFAVLAEGVVTRAPAEERLHLPAAQPGGRRQGRPLARESASPWPSSPALISHCRPGARPLDPVPDQPVLGLPGHAGTARHLRHRRRPAASGQALDRLPQAVRPARRQVRRELVLHGLERLSIAVLVASAIFQLATGLANSAQWYPWDFSLPGHPLRRRLDRDRRTARCTSQ